MGSLVGAQASLLILFLGWVFFEFAKSGILFLWKKK
jgi:hypothetical protein